MAFMKYINDPIGILILVMLTLPSIAANIDCNGKPFHCMNSTHFMICVDLGSGVSSTIDDFVIPCPPTTVCQGTNRFECEFPAVPSTTTTVIAPSAAPQVTSVSETIGIGTSSFYGTTTIPFEEYFNTLSTTTLSEDVLRTQQAIVTESILVTDVIDKTDVITPEFESNSTLSGTIPKATNFTPLNNLSSPAIPTNVSDTVTESIFTGVIETIPNINVELNLTALNTALPDNSVDIVTVTEHINLIEPKSILTSNGTIPSGNILGNYSTTHYTQSSSALADNADAIVKKNKVTEETESVNVVRPDPNTILSGSPASIENVVNDLTSLNDSGSTVDTDANETSMTENLNVLQPNITFTEDPASVDVVQNDLISLNASSSTSINIKAVNNVTENMNIIKPGPKTTLSETSANVDVVTHELTSLDASSSTTIETEAVTNVTENLNVFVPEPNTTLSKIPKSVDVIQNDPTLFNASNSTGIDMEEITNVTENITAQKPEPKTLTKKSRIDYIITHDPTSLDASSSAAIDPKTITNVKENINVIKPGPNTLSGTLGSDDFVTQDPSSLDALSSTAIDTELVTNVTENLHVLKTESNKILTETPASVDVVTHEPTSLDALGSNATNTEAVTNVSNNIHLIKQGPYTTLSGTSGSDEIATHDLTSLDALSSTTIDTESVTNMTDNIHFIKPGPNNTTLIGSFGSDNVVKHDPTSLDASNSTAIDTEAVTNVTENLNVIKTEPTAIMSEIPENTDVVQKNSTSLNTSTTTAIDTKYMIENINVIKPEPINTLNKMPARIDVILNVPIPVITSSSTVIDTETVTNATDTINAIKPGPNTFSGTLGSDDVVVTHDPTSLGALSSTAIYSESVTNVTENLNVLKTESNTMTKSPASVDFVTLTSLNTLSSTTVIDTDAVSNVTDNINLIKPGPNTTFNGTSGSDDVVIYDPTSLDASSSTAIDAEAVTNMTENLNVIKTEPTAILIEIPESTGVVQNNSTSLNTSTTTAIDTKNIIENINVIKPDSVTILNEIAARIDVIINYPISFNTSSSAAVDTEAVTNVTDNINVIKPELNTTLGGTLTSFDVVLNDPTLLNVSSSTGIDSASNDLMQNEFTIPYTPNSTASLNNVTSDILLISVNATNKVNKIENYRKVTTTSSAGTTSQTNQGSSTISYTIVDVLTNQTDGKPVHSEKVISTTTIENTTSTPTLVIKDNGIIVTDNPLEHPVSKLKSSSNIDSINLDTYSTTTIKKPFTDIPVSEPPTEVTTSLVTDTTGVITLDTAIVNDNKLNATHLESNSTQKSVQTNTEDGSELSPHFTAPEFVPNTESPKEIYFIASKQHASIFGDRNSTAVNDYYQLVTKYNKPTDSSSISSMDKSSAGATNIPVITESVDELTNTEQNTLATIFTITETGQEFNSELSNVVSITESAYLQNTIKVGKAFNEAATIATTSTTTDSYLSSSTNIGQHSTKEVKDINVTVFISETDTDKFHNTRPAIENRPVTIIEGDTLLEVNTVSSTTSSVPEFEPTTTEMITTTAANNSYVEPPLYVKSVETTFNSLFNLQSETTPSLEINTGSNGIKDVLSINFNASQTNISRNLLNTAQKASSTVTQEMVTDFTKTELPVQNSTTGIVIRNTSELSRGSLENTLPSNASGDGNSLTDSYSSVHEANFTVKATGENMMFKNNAMGTASIDVGVTTRIPEETVQITTIKVDELYEKSISKTLEKKAFGGSTKQEIYPESNILNTGSGKLSEISTSIKDMPDVQIKTKSRVIPLIETSQAKQLVVPSEQSPANYLGSVPTLHSIATETQIPKEVQQQQPPTAYYEDTSHNQQNVVFQQDGTPLHNLDIQTTNYQIITQHIKKNTTKMQIEIPTNLNTTRDIANKEIKTTNNASFEVHSAFDNQPFVKAKMQNQDNKVEDSHIVAQSGSTSSHSELSKIFSPTSIQYSDTLSHLEQNTESWRATVVTNPSVQMKSSIIDKQPLITTTRPATETSNISKIKGINVRNTGPNLDVVVSNTVKQFINVTQVISPSIIAPKPLMVVTSTTEPPPEPSNKISKTVTVPSVLDLFITNPNIVAEQPPIVTSKRPNTTPWRTKAEPDYVPRNIDGGQTTVDHLVSIPKTEFINVSRIVLGQTEQTITQNSLDLNSDVDIVIMDIMKPINANSVLGEPTGSGTHSEISVILKPPLKSLVEQNQKTEASESVEKGKEWGWKPKTLESIEGEQNVGSSAIETTVAISKDSKFVNDNIDQKGSELQYTTYNIMMESTIEITTKKMEEKPDQSNSTIEQYSSTVNSTTKKSAQNKVTHDVSPDLIKKSVKITNITSDIINSTARYTPQTNKHNASVPILKPATKSHKFVCKLNKRGRFSDIKDCRKFYICIGRVEPIEGICPNNTVFSELRKQCTKNLSHCVRNSQFQCVSEGRFSDYLNDGIYYICVKNNVGKFIRFKLQCQSGYHLNKTSVRCTLNTESTSTSQQSMSDISKDSNVSSAKSEMLVKESSKNKKFECKKEGKFPEASNCRKYYICTKIGKSQYQQKSKKCDSDELFHKDKKKCVDADSYECS